MRTKRDMFVNALENIVIDRSGKLYLLKEYDNAPDDKPLTSELPRPAVHEIAMHLLAAQGQGMPRSGKEARAMARAAYKVAQEIYDVGNEYEHDQDNTGDTGDNNEH